MSEDSKEVRFDVSRGHLYCTEIYLGNSKTTPQPSCLSRDPKAICNTGVDQLDYCLSKFSGTVVWVHQGLECWRNFMGTDFHKSSTVGDSTQ